MLQMHLCTKKKRNVIVMMKNFGSSWSSENFVIVFEMFSILRVNDANVAVKK